MGLDQMLRDYPAHPDPATAACNRIALLVAASQPFYPVYVLWIVGGDWWVSFWTFLSTPLFVAVPALARRHSLAGKALLPLAGVANAVLSAKIFGIESGVEAFLTPCLLIAILAFRRNPGAILALVTMVVAVAGLHGHYGASIGHFTIDQYAHFRRLNFYSAAILSAAAVWALIPARRATALQ